MPSLAHAGAARRAALVAAVVEHADDVDVGIALRGSEWMSVFAVGIGADHDGTAIEAAFARPAAHQQEQQRAGTRSARTGRARRSCRARPARTGRRLWRRTRRRWRSETRPTRPRRAACIASRGRGRPAPDRCRRPGTPAWRAARCRGWRRRSARQSRRSAPRSRNRRRDRRARPARIRSGAPCRRARSANRRARRAAPRSSGDSWRRIGARQCRHCRRYRRGRLEDLAGSRLGDDRHVFCRLCLLFLPCQLPWAGRGRAWDCPAGRRAGKIVNKIQKLVMRIERVFSSRVLLDTRPVRLPPSSSRRTRSRTRAAHGRGDTVRRRRIVERCGDRTGERGDVLRRDQVHRPAVRRFPGCRRRAVAMIGTPAAAASSTT